MSQKRVVCAAIKHPQSGAVIAGPRHFDGVMRATIGKSLEWYEAEQGFIDQHGNYLSRTEAWKVAEAAGQILRRCGGDTANGGTLYSENLY